MVEIANHNRPFGTKEQTDAFKSATEGIKPSKSYDETKARPDKLTGQVFVPYSESYTPDQVKKVADKYGELASESKPMQNHYWNQLHDPQIYQDYNAAYQSVYGAKDKFGMANIVDTPVKAAKAAAIINAKVPTGQGEEPKPDINYRHRLSQENIYLNANLQKKGAELAPPPFDGTNYDLSSGLQGIKVAQVGTTALGFNPKEKLLYNPETKVVTYTTLDGKKKSEPYDEFKNTLSTVNTAQDLKVVDAVKESIENAERARNNPPKPSGGGKGKPTTYKIVKVKDL
jgi:hypothetical protein